ncbi:MAG: chromosomal replication initiator protein DnaA [Elusimicrobia bacterium]|nr:chromosomal replication initiator protein DnaA [Elusimicrobiota bacterium]
MDNSEKITELWKKTLLKLEEELGVEPVDLWIRPIKPLFMDDNSIKIEVPDSIIYEKVNTRYEGKIIKIIEELTGRVININYSMSLEKIKPQPKQEPLFYQEIQPPRKNSFNPNFIFKSFVMGNSNRWAYSSAEAVAKNPGTHCNPFFIYSQPGLGKTHLLHAIANEMLNKNPQAKIIYTPSENFVNEYIEAIQTKNIERFRNKYRKLDCLLLDDIQFLAGKDKSAEEFFYTFNPLFESKKQIVITSDRPPKELSLEERLISRFLSGVVADIRYPELETRIAILRQKNESLSFQIPDDVTTFIGENVKKSIRELEGALLTVGNYCINMNIQPSIDVVKQLIRDKKIAGNQDEDDSIINVDIIKEIVADKYNLNLKDFKSSRKMEGIAFPRQVAMYLTCQLTNMSLPSIGLAFNKDHSTVIYARKKIEKEIYKDPFFNEVLNQLIKKIKTVDKSF